MKRVLDWQRIYFDIRSRTCNMGHLLDMPLSTESHTTVPAGRLIVSGLLLIIQLRRGADQVHPSPTPTSIALHKYTSPLHIAHHVPNSFTMSQSVQSTSSKTILELGNGITVREYVCTGVILGRHVLTSVQQLSDAKDCSRHANNRNIWLNLRDRFPHPYTEDNALSWIKHCQSPDSYARSGSWSAEAGAGGPLLPTNFIVAINGEASGSIGIDFGTGIVTATSPQIEHQLIVCSEMSIFALLNWGIGSQKSTGERA